MLYSIAYGHREGVFDTLRVETSGVLRVDGWHRNPRTAEIEIPVCLVSGERLPLLHVFRTYRPDVAAAISSDNPLHGMACTFRLSATPTRRPARVALRWENREIFSVEGDFTIIPPVRAPLLDTALVQHRDDIYRSGPPATAVNDVVLALAQRLPGPILDFGCGLGVLVERLRECGSEAYGIEVDRPPIRENLTPAVKPLVKLYDGAFPLPYGDGQFRSVLATEVIEHVADYPAALAEIARVSSESFLITVPDMSAIPLCHHNGVVPWHLLESTHVNFFTQTSLKKALEPFFREVEMARLSPVTTNDSVWFCTLVATCRK
jgi:SAM-dependent methyltransferase